MDLEERKERRSAVSLPAFLSRASLSIPKQETLLRKIY